MPTIKKTCSRPWIVEREIQGGRIHNNSKFYQSTPWRRVRKIKLQLNPLCEECERNGRIVSGRVIDHIIPISRGGGALSLENLQTLCDSCHNKKSGQESHTRAGR